MTWACRGCGNEGYQPFAGAKSIEFWIRDQGSPGSVPNVHLVLGNPEMNKWCNSEVALSGQTAAASEGDWRKVRGQQFR